MKKDYQKPTINVVKLQNRTMLLTGSNDLYDVIPSGFPNLPPG